MLTALSELLYDAREHHYGIPALAVENELNLRCAIQASEESRSPLILLSGYSHTRDPEFFTATLNYYCDKAKTPVAVIMDHTATFEKAISGIRMGFGSIMVDRSKLPFEENASQVQSWCGLLMPAVWRWSQSWVMSAGWNMNLEHQVQEP